MLSARVRSGHPGFMLDVELSAPADSTLVLVGESGAGKTSFLRALAGLIHPEAGRIALDGAVLFDAESGISLPPWERSVGFLSQDYALFPHLSVFENVAFGLRARGMARGQVRAAVHEALERFELSALAARRPDQLSSGQQQRVGLARALATGPRLLLLDEPLSALDLQTRRTIRGELRRLLEALPGVTVFVTHLPIEALAFGDRIAVMEEGRITQLGSPDELLRRPRSAYVAEFMGVNLLRGRVLETGGGGLTTVGTADGPVTVAGPDLPRGNDLFVAVSPREITLYRGPPDGSARNLYRGRITELVPEPPFGERVRVVLATHPPLVAEVTQGAVRELGLVEGQEVYASFKATGAVAYS